MIFDKAIQGSDEWKAVRRGVITASRFKDCRDFLTLSPADRKRGITRPEPSAKHLLYAMDLARERSGGTAPAKFQTKYMAAGRVEESPACRAYEVETGNLIKHVGFAYTEDRMFGVSVDGLVRPKGAVEAKLMASSETMFRCLSGDISEFIDQCYGAIWLLDLDWVDLLLWAPDLEPIGRALTIRRIERNEEAIRSLEADLMAFARRVSEFERILQTPAMAMAA